MDTMFTRPTFDDERKFSDQYMNLVSFLCEFLDLYDRLKTLQEVIVECLQSQRYCFETKTRIVQEGRIFMQQETLPWSLVSSTTNRCFDTKEEAFTWLSDALDQIEATLRA